MIKIGIYKQFGGAICLLFLLLSASVNSADIELNGNLLQGSLIRGKLIDGAEVELNGQTVEVSSDGHFVIGFGRDDEQKHELRYKLPNSENWQSKTLEIVKREYRIQRIDGLEQNKVTPPESVLAKIRDDARRVAIARSKISQQSGFSESFIWPSTGPISGVYGSQRVLNGTPSRPHFGVDVAAPTGTLVVAPASGVVTMADPDLYYSGGTLIIDHGMGVFSTFLHLDSLSVSVGEKVQQGDKIGEIGETGRATGPHLDWRINWQRVRLDPALLVPAREGLDYTAASN